MLFASARTRARSTAELDSSGSGGALRRNSVTAMVNAASDKTAVAIRSTATGDAISVPPRAGRRSRTRRSGDAWGTMHIRSCGCTPAVSLPAAPRRPQLSSVAVNALGYVPCAVRVRSVLDFDVDPRRTRVVRAPSSGVDPVHARVVRRLAGAATALRHSSSATTEQCRTSSLRLRTPLPRNIREPLHPVARFAAPSRAEHDGGGHMVPQQHGRARRFSALAAIGAALLTASRAAAELCWEYTDLESAKVPITCVEQGNTAVNCSWDPLCNLDLDPSDCCITIPDVVPATVGEMHVDWHNCLRQRRQRSDPAARRARAALVRLPSPVRGRTSTPFATPWPSQDRVARVVPGHDDAVRALRRRLDARGSSTRVRPRPQPAQQHALRRLRALPAMPLPQRRGTGGVSRAGLPVCAAGGVSFMYDSLDDFQSAEEIATLLDVYFHGKMHGAVAFADGGGYIRTPATPAARRATRCSGACTRRSTTSCAPGRTSTPST